MRRTAESRDSGFTLLEVLVSMTLMGIIMAIAVAPYRNYHRTQAHQGTTRKLVASLRNAQVSAVAEDTRYRVTFTADGQGWTVQREGASGWATVGAPGRVEDAMVVLRDISFRQTDGSLAASVVFLPRGSATKGSLTVGRVDRAKVYTVTVEGLTARVSYTS